VKWKREARRAVGRGGRADKQSRAQQTWPRAGAGGGGRLGVSKSVETAAVVFCALFRDGGFSRAVFTCQGSRMPSAANSRTRPGSLGGGFPVAPPNVSPSCHVMYPRPASRLSACLHSPPLCRQRARRMAGSSHRPRSRRITLQCPLLTGVFAWPR
jgi:hypothetical protein